MHIGFSRIKITPPGESDLCGYGYFLNRRTGEVLDDLYAHALLISGSESEFLLINCDLLMFSHFVVQTARRRISAVTGLSPDQILLLCTHTHTAPPAVLTIGCGEIDFSYLEFLFNCLEQTALDAAANRHLVQSIEYASSAIKPIGINRTDPDGPLDTNVYVLRFQLEGHRPYMLINHACHPVSLGRTALISPDYPGDVIRALREDGSDGMYLNGFCGDVNPVRKCDPWQDADWQVLRRYGQAVADGAREALLGGAKDIETTMHYADISFEIEREPYDGPDIERIFADHFSQLEPTDGTRRAAREWADCVKWRIMNEKNPYSDCVQVQLLSLGDCVLVGAPGELYTKIGMDIRHGTSRPLLLCSNANATIGYISTDGDLNEHSYGGFASNLVFGSLPIRPGMADRYAHEVNRGICQLSPAD